MRLVLLLVAAATALLVGGAHGQPATAAPAAGSAACRVSYASNTPLPLLFGGVQQGCRGALCQPRTTYVVRGAGVCVCVGGGGAQRSGDLAAALLLPATDVQSMPLTLLHALPSCARAHAHRARSAGCVTARAGASAPRSKQIRRWVRGCAVSCRVVPTVPVPVVSSLLRCGGRAAARAPVCRRVLPRIPAAAAHATRLAHPCGEPPPPHALPLPRSASRVQPMRGACWATLAPTCLPASSCPTCRAAPRGCSGAWPRPWPWACVCACVCARVCVCACVCVCARALACDARRCRLLCACVSRARISCVPPAATRRVSRHTRTRSRTSHARTTTRARCMRVLRSAHAR
jgi:hypothetical protein